MFGGIEKGMGRGERQKWQARRAGSAGQAGQAHLPAKPKQPGRARDATAARHTVRVIPGSAPRPRRWLERWRRHSVPATQRPLCAMNVKVLAADTRCSAARPRPGSRLRHGQSHRRAQTCHQNSSHVASAKMIRASSAVARHRNSSSPPSFMHDIPQKQTASSPTVISAGPEMTPLLVLVSNDDPVQLQQVTARPAVEQMSPSCSAVQPS